MRTFSIFFIAVLYACTTSTAGERKEKMVFDQKSSDKVLIELFTSQGCSSCPSADKLVSSLAQTDTNIIVLSFHVDYWDRLGWKDVFSNHAFTVRQQQYAQTFHSESVYTPQAVVQGQFEMVGSNKPGITAALAKARETDNNTTLAASATLNNNDVDIQYSINKTSSNQQLVVALVQTHASTSIQRGENSGVQLEGYNVVRDFTILPVHSANGNVSLKLPADMKKENASVVLFIQDIASKKVVSVTQVNV